MEVKNTEMADLDQIFALFEQSIQYQERRGYPVWKNYDRNAVIKDVANKNQYKILIDSVMAIVFSVCWPLSTLSTLVFRIFPFNKC